MADEQLQGRAQEDAQQPEAEQAGPPAGAGQTAGQALEQRLAQALQPVLAEHHQHLRQAVRQQIEQEVGPIRKELQQEVEQAREPRRQEAEEQRAQLGSVEGQQAIQGLQPALFRMLLNLTRGLVEQQAELWLERIVPSEVRRHLRASQREQLLALRAWLNVAIERIEQ